VKIINHRASANEYAKAVRDAFKDNDRKRLDDALEQVKDLVHHFDKKTGAVPMALNRKEQLAIWKANALLIAAVCKMSEED